MHLPSITTTNLTLGIILARFREPLYPWLPVANNTYVYAKGSIPQANDTVPFSRFKSYISLPNVGREGQTHLHHIVSHYDGLEDVMIFSQADPFDLLAPVVNTSTQMAEMAMGVGVDEVSPFNPSLFHDLAEWGAINWTSPNESLWITPSQIIILKMAPYTIGEFWEMVLGFPHPPAIRAMHGGIFAVRKETIRSRPRDVYERALREFEKADDKNPEVGFFMERLWAPLFSGRYWLRGVEVP